MIRATISKTSSGEETVSQNLDEIEEVVQTKPQEHEQNRTLLRTVFFFFFQSANDQLPARKRTRAMNVEKTST